MKRILCASLFALLLLRSGDAHAAEIRGPWPYKIEAGANAYFRVYKYPQTPPQLGPWYLYWPLEAHFQTQAPAAYGVYPQQYTLPPNFRPPVPTPIPQFQPPAPTPLPPFQAPAPTPLPDNGKR